MIRPAEIIAKPPPIHAQGDLLKLHRVYGRCVGILSPVVWIDRKGEQMPGFDALVYHECAHAAEVHAFTGIVILLGAAVSFSLTVAMLTWFTLLLGFVLLGTWVWWMREREIRADAVALYGAGIREFNAFLYMHQHPNSLWGEWCYGRTRDERWKRAGRRCVRLGWSVSQ